MKDGWCYESTILADGDGSGMFFSAVPAGMAGTGLHCGETWKRQNAERENAKLTKCRTVKPKTGIMETQKRENVKPTKYKAAKPKAAKHRSGKTQKRKNTERESACFLLGHLAAAKNPRYCVQNERLAVWPWQKAAVFLATPKGQVSFAHAKLTCLAISATAEMAH